jgi:cytochrome c-type biogenesis protein CcmE
VTSPDLSPRPVEPVVGRRPRRVLPSLVLVAAILAGGVVVTRFLTSAVDYYCNVDEVGLRRGCDRDRRLRLQGTVTEGSVESDGLTTSFDIEFDDVTIGVDYDGEPGGIFKECIPVVVHGYFDSSNDRFMGDRVEVKHSDEYVSVNDARLTEARESACQPSA